MRRLLAIALLILTTLTPAHAEEVVLGMSKDQVSITTSFDGSEILIFGAVKREEPIPGGAPLEVIITVAGPSHPIMVRRKAKWGNVIWVNTDAVEVDRAPSYYAVATTGPLDAVLDETEDLRHRITVDRAIRSVGAPAEIKDAESFTEALIRVRRSQGLYQQLDGAVSLDQQTLFRAAVAMPANLTEGAYDTRIFLTRDGKVVSHYETTIDVRKVGLERFLFSLSREKPMIYGFMSLFIAIAAGWSASFAFTLLRNS